MSSIITATDFSDIANNAAHYACNIAAALNKSVTIVHSYQIPVAFSENPIPVASIEESKIIAREELDKFGAELFAAYPQLGISLDLAYGDITDILKDRIEADNTNIVVVGNSSSDDSGFWLGGNLLNSLRSLPCPVIAVPKNYTFKKVENIAFACDFKHVAETIPASDLIRLVNQIGGSLHVLNVDHENKNFDPESPHEFAQLDNLIKEANPKYHHIDADDVEKGIDTFVAANNIDWLIVVPHKHNFFESLFHKSQTKALVSHATIPIVALHEIK